MNGFIVVDVSRETLDYLINHVSRETVSRFTKSVSRETFLFTVKSETETNLPMFHVKHGLISTSSESKGDSLPFRSFEGA